MRFLALLLVMTGCGLQAVEETGQEVAPVPQAVAPADLVMEPKLLPLPTALPVEPILSSGEHERTLKDTTTWIALSLNEGTVFCSAIGYGSSFLKVSVPDLDWLAHFDHRADTLGLPCAAAGECSDVLNPETILQSRPGVESVALRVILTEVLSVDVEGQRCQRWLREEVQAVVRGVPLRHRVQGEPQEVPFETCRALAALD